MTEDGRDRRFQPAPTAERPLVDETTQWWGLLSPQGTLIHRCETRDQARDEAKKRMDGCAGGAAIIVHAVEVIEIPRPAPQVRVLGPAVLEG